MATGYDSALDHLQALLTTIVVACKTSCCHQRWQSSTAVVAPCVHLTKVVKSVDVAHNSYEQVDDLFKQIRLCLLKVRQSDPVIADELKGLVRQLEDWVESLVVNSLKLESLESMLHSTIQLAKRLQERTDRK